MPGFTPVQPLTGRQREKLCSPGPKFGAVTRAWPARCAFELRLCGVQVLVGAWWLDAAARGIPETM